MIEIRNVSKSFEDIKAIDDLTASIRDGEVFGLVGTNGSGKSTLLRLIAGVLKPDFGEIEMDGKAVYENPEVKQEICFISDTAYFFPNATPKSMMEFYKIAYPRFDTERFAKLTGALGLNPDRKVNTFSKGMKKQLSVLLGVCAGTKYLLCDETFDGLDPVMRQAVKSIFMTEMMDRSFVPVIASHNLRELEDICDHVGLLHKGGILLSENLDDLKFRTQKVQCVIRDAQAEAELIASPEVMTHEKRGSILTLIARGTEDEVMHLVHSREPLFAESLPLTLEEIFIFETEVAGYDIRNILS